MLNVFHCIWTNGKFNIAYSRIQIFLLIRGKKTTLIFNLQAGMKSRKISLWLGDSSKIRSRLWDTIHRIRLSFEDHRHAVCNYQSCCKLCNRVRQQQEVSINYGIVIKCRLQVRARAHKARFLFEPDKNNDAEYVEKKAPLRDDFHPRLRRQKRLWTVWHSSKCQHTIRITLILQLVLLYNFINSHISATEHTYWHTNINKNRNENIRKNKH